MSAPDTSQTLPAPAWAPIACPIQERRNLVISKLLVTDTELDRDALEPLFELAKKDAIRQLLALANPPPTITESYCSWLADKMVWTRFGT